ncbi:hypothetical protein RJ639_027367 [Escallonia herrerae]|uniref:Uncharacterized protein n=1 Tax=Escallonia herrerae TaxID=1293975 RepID=A0AA88XHB2_9ASTE|nr:hypothetical protein RJ639_027367 [Escallonia herrerae]
MRQTVVANLIINQKLVVLHDCTAITRNKMIKTGGSIFTEMEVNVSASKAWTIYGTTDLLKITLPNYLKSVEILEGDGGVGTICRTTPLEGMRIILFFRRPSYLEKFTKVDNENLVKEVDIIEGAFLDYGFNFYRIRFENILTGENSCLTRTTLLFDVKEEYVANVSLVPIGTSTNIMKDISAASYLEKFTKVDNENLVREVDRVEGAFLDYGFNLFRIRFENIVTVEYSCLTRTTIMFDVKEEYVANVVSSFACHFLGIGVDCCALLVTQLLNGDNYPTWSRAAIMPLKANNKLGFIDKIIKEPAPDSAELSSWTRCNSMATSWLIHSTIPAIANSILWTGPSYLEKFTEVDNENLVKEVDIIEGAFLYYGFNFYQICFENIVTGENSCLTRTTIPFDVKEKYVAYVSLIPIGTSMNIMKDISADVTADN